MAVDLRVQHHPVLGEAPACKQVRFLFAGRELEGLAGEPIAVALLANGIYELRCAEGSGAPRGLYCGIGHCYECRVTVDGERNVRSCLAVLQEGMRIETEQAVGGDYHDA